MWLALLDVEISAWSLFTSAEITMRGARTRTKIASGHSIRFTDYTGGIYTNVTPKDD